MYKAYLVEDESAVRNAIRDKIEWEEEGFLFVGEAPDGEIALQEISELLPDLVITDIKMPFMDGLELSARLKRLFPRIRVVILTGHNDFQFAQEAIRSGVNDYLLKPLSAEMLRETLSKIFIQMENERKIYDELIDLKEEQQKTLLFRRGRFLRDFCMPLSSGDEGMDNQSLAIGIETDKKYAALLLIQKNLITSVPSPSPVWERRVKAYLQWMTSDSPGYYFVEFSLERYGIVVLGDERHLLEERNILLALTIKENLFSHFSLSATISIGKIVSGLEGLNASYLDAHSLLREYGSLDKILFRDEADGNRYFQIVKKVKEMVAMRFNDPDLSLTEVAAEAAVSPGRLSTIFHQETGEKFISYLNRIRLERSQELLLTTYLTVAEIGERCGYNQSHYFSSLFKRVFGDSPYNYRKKGR